MNSDLEEYILRHSEAEPEYLYRLWRATNVHTIHGRMASGHLQGRLLKMLVEMIQPKRMRPWIEGSAVADKIEFIIGDAIEEAPKLGITFDLAFIDGDKRTYRKCYEMVLSILRPGGFILADNTLWDGHVVDHAYDNDHQTQGIEAFNDFIAQDNRVEKVILPLRDGLTIIRKK